MAKKSTDSQTVEATKTLSQSPHDGSQGSTRGAKKYQPPSSDRPGADARRVSRNTQEDGLLRRHDSDGSRAASTSTAKPSLSKPRRNSAERRLREKGAKDYKRTGFATKLPMERPKDNNKGATPRRSRGGEMTRYIDEPSVVSSNLQRSKSSSSATKNSIKPKSKVRSVDNASRRSTAEVSSDKDKLIRASKASRQQTPERQRPPPLPSHYSSSGIHKHKPAPWKETKPSDNTDRYDKQMYPALPSISSSTTNRNRGHDRQLHHSLPSTQARTDRGMANLTSSRTSRSRRHPASIKSNSGTRKEKIHFQSVDFDPGTKARPQVKDYEDKFNQILNKELSRSRSTGGSQPNIEHDLQRRHSAEEVEKDNVNVNSTGSKEISRSSGGQSNTKTKQGMLMLTRRHSAEETSRDYDEFYPPTLSQEIRLNSEDIKAKTKHHNLHSTMLSNTQSSSNIHEIVDMKQPSSMLGIETKADREEQEDFKIRDGILLESSRKSKALQQSSVSGRSKHKGAKNVRWHSNTSNDSSMGGRGRDGGGGGDASPSSKNVNNAAPNDIPRDTSTSSTLVSYLDAKPPMSSVGALAEDMTTSAQRYSPSSNNTSFSSSLLSGEGVSGGNRLYTTPSLSPRQKHTAAAMPSVSLGGAIPEDSPYDDDHISTVDRAQDSLSISELDSIIPLSGDDDFTIVTGTSHQHDGRDELTNNEKTFVAYSAKEAK